MKNQQWLFPFLFSAILLLAFWIRIQGTERIPTGSVYRKRCIFLLIGRHALSSENGKLPARDMHRWLPLGRDLGQTLNLYGYVPRLRTQNRCCGVPARHALPRHPLHAPHLLLHRTRRALSFPLPHERTSLFKYRWCPFSNTPRVALSVVLQDSETGIAGASCSGCLL